MSNEKTIVGKECRFVVHLPEIRGVREDTHLVKEIIHYEDGTKEPNLKKLVNFKRPFWITKPFFQNYKEKKEYELLENVDMFTSTQSRLANSVAARLGKQAYFRNNIRDVRDSPYVYGIDIHSNTIIKNAYQEKYSNIQDTPYSVCAFDIETNTLTGDIIIATITMEDKVYTVINNSLVKGIDKVEDQLKYLYDKYIPDTDIKKKAKVVNRVFSNEVDMLKDIFREANEWMPDFLAIWNIEYDIRYIMERLDKHRVPYEEVFCDPTLPKELKHFKYIQGSKQKLTESGKFTPINAHQQWHVTECSSTFYIIDAMTAFYHIRTGGKQLPGGYSLDNVLNQMVKLAKLKFKDDTNLVKLEWHRYMVENRPLQYIIYNQWDTMSMIELDKKTKDLSHSLPLLAGVSDFKIFNSGPKKIVDAMHFFFLKHGKVIGGRPNQVDDNKLLGLGGWITILLPYRLKAMGLPVTVDKVDQIINDNLEKIANYRGDRLSTNVFTLVCDLDVTSAYPSATLACNVSKATTLREVTKIEDIPLDTFRRQNINLIINKINSVAYCTEMMNFPTLVTLKEKIKKKLHERC